MKASTDYAHRLRQLKETVGLNPGEVLDGLKIPEQPERYLMAEFAVDFSGGLKRVSFAPSVQELALDWENSETAQGLTTEFWDLDGDETSLIPRKHILGFFTPDKTFLGATNKRDGLSEQVARQAIRTARAKFADANIDIDDNATLGVCDNGVLIDASVWVSFDDAKICPECQQSVEGEDDHAHCNGKDCGERVTPDAMYYATPCGTYCNACMGKHASECPVCAHQFGLLGSGEIANR